MKSTRIPVYVCACGYRLDATSGANCNAVPSVGDITLCIKCGRLYEFTEGLVMQPVPDERESALPGDAQLEIARIRHAIHELRKQKNL